MASAEFGVLNEHFSRQSPGKEWGYVMGQRPLQVGCSCSVLEGMETEAEMDVNHAVLINIRARELLLACFIYFQKQPERTSTSIPELS